MVEANVQGAVPQEPPKEPQPLPKPEDLTKLIDQKIAVGMEAAKRELQSFKDKARAEIEAAHQRAKSLEREMDEFDASLKDVDGETAQRIKLARYEGRDRLKRQEDEQQKAQQQIRDTITNFDTQMTQYITDMGIDSSDSRIEWGDRDSMDLLARQKVILSSVSKIQRENIKTAETKLREELSQQLKDAENKLRKDLGLDKVNIGSGASISSTSDAEFMKQFSAGEIPANKENLSRLKKIQEGY